MDVEMFSAGGVAQVVEHLPRKSEVLSSNSSTEKKKKKNRDVFRVGLVSCA
jgi:hypothetical protein